MIFIAPVIEGCAIVPPRFTAREAVPPSAAPGENALSTLKSAVPVSARLAVGSGSISTSPPSVRTVSASPNRHAKRSTASRPFSNRTLVWPRWVIGSPATRRSRSRKVPVARTLARSSASASRSSTTPSAPATSSNATGSTTPDNTSGRTSSRLTCSRATFIVSARDSIPDPR